MHEAVAAVLSCPEGCTPAEIDRALSRVPVSDFGEVAAADGAGCSATFVLDADYWEVGVSVMPPVGPADGGAPDAPCTVSVGMGA